MLCQAISQRCLYHKQIVDKRHERKLRKPTNANDEYIKKKWVTNLSQRKLNNDEISLLRKGLNFAVTPKSIPNKEILASVVGLTENERDEVRGKIYSTLKNAKPPVQQNLSRGERQAMKDLKSDSNIVIIRADKGNSTVIMDKTSYNNQLREMLQDQDVYSKVIDKRRNPTTKVESVLQNALLRLRKSKNLTESEYWKLRPFDSSAASFYGLPKIHKVPLIAKQDYFTIQEGIPVTVPLRPINSCTVNFRELF